MVLMLPAPLLLLWFLSPSIAWWISQPRVPDVFEPTAAQTRFLRVLARQTWAFFDTHVGPADHWLPPDNVQEQPGPPSPIAPRRPTSAWRCSPTWRPMTSVS